MANKDGIEFKFTSNERDLIRGAGDAETALEGVSDALDDIANAGDDKVSFADAVREANRLEDAGEQAGRAIDAGMDRAADEVDRLGDKMRDAERRNRDLGDAGQRAGRDIDDSMDRASEGVDEFRDEANSTAREAAASFDGSAESIVDAFQEVAANAFAGFGPAGAAAGLAAAAGIGLVVAAFGQNAEALERQREAAAEWAQAFIDAGGRVLSSQQQVAMLQDIVTDPQKWQDAQDNAREWGVSVSTAMRAMTGDAEALAEANAALTEREQAAAEAAYRMADGGEALADSLLGATAETRNGRAALDELQGAITSGQDAAEAYNDAMRETARETAGATSSVDGLGNAVYQLPDGSRIIIDAETGAARHELDEVASDVRNLPDGTANVQVNVNDAQLRNYLHKDLNRTAYVNVQTRAGRSVMV